MYNVSHNQLMLIYSFLKDCSDFKEDELTNKTAKSGYLSVLKNTLTESNMIFAITLEYPEIQVSKEIIKFIIKNCNLSPENMNQFYIDHGVKDVKKA